MCINSKIRERIKVQPYFLSKWEDIYIQLSSDINNRTKCVEFNLPADGSTYLINYGISFNPSNNNMFKAYITFDITENRQTWCGNDIISDGYSMRVDLSTVIIVTNEAEGRCSINACTYTHIPVYAIAYLIRVTRLYYDWS